MHEFARFEQHFHAFKADICKTTDDAEKPFVSKLPHHVKDKLARELAEGTSGSD